MQTLQLLRVNTADEPRIPELWLGGNRVHPEIEYHETGLATVEFGYLETCWHGLPKGIPCSRAYYQLGQKREEILPHNLTVMQQLLAHPEHLANLNKSYGHFFWGTKLRDNNGNRFVGYIQWDFNHIFHTDLAWDDESGGRWRGGYIMLDNEWGEGFLSAIGRKPHPIA